MFPPSHASDLCAAYNMHGGLQYSTGDAGYAEEEEEWCRGGGDEDLHAGHSDTSVANPPSLVISLNGGGVL